jgi:phosphoglycolate phosphatase
MTSRYVCFDFDGTLVDSRHDIAAAVNRLREEYGLEPVSVETVAAAIGGGAWVLIDETFPDHLEPETEQLLEEFRPIYRSICADNIRPYEGIEPLLSRLTDARLAIVTNKPLDMTEKIVRRLDWEERFEPVYGADSFDRMKPDPTPLEAVAEDWGVDTGDLIMVGDSWTDIRAGNAAGCRTVATLYGLGDSGETLEEAPEATVESVEELGPVLLNGR